MSHQCNHHNDSPWLYRDTPSAPILASSTNRESTESNLRKILDYASNSKNQIGVSCTVRVLLNREFYVTGEPVTGRVEISCVEAEGMELVAANVAAAIGSSGTAVGLGDGLVWFGEISIEITGYEGKDLCINL